MILLTVNANKASFVDRNVISSVLDLYIETRRTIIRVSSWEDENVLKLIMGMVVPLGQVTKIIEFTC